MGILHLSIECPTCAAPIGCSCRTRKGRKSKPREFPHRQRMRTIVRIIQRRVWAGNPTALDEVDCTECGACCYSHPWGSGRCDPFVSLSTMDTARLWLRGLPTVSDRPGDSYSSVNEGEPAGLALPVKRGRCAYLTGCLGGPVACSIYEDRPHVCRDMIPGDTLCRIARYRMGIPLEDEPSEQRPYLLQKLAECFAILSISTMRDDEGNMVLPGGWA